MELFEVFLVLGLAGLIVMCLPSLGRHGARGAGRGAHVLPHAGHASTSPHGGRAPRAPGRPFPARFSVSPRTIFGICLAFGASGMALSELPGLPHPALFGLALVAALAIQRGLFDPIWNGLLQFASEPSHSLESLVMTEARAATGFDPSGSGVVEVRLDGQVVQVLGRLAANERQLGAHVRQGDIVRIESVDPKSGACVVSRRPGIEAQ